MDATTQVKERPVLFSGAMVRALLNGTKTQTRRAVKWPVKSTTHHVSINESDQGPIAAWCPYGQPGERLWVRETHAWYPGDKSEAAHWLYRATSDGPTQMWVHFENGWKPSIFMKREASRLLLEIVAVRCERLQDISEADAIAEGIDTLFSAEEIATTKPPLPFASPADSGWRNYLWHGNPELTTVKKAEWAHQYSSYTKPVDSYSSLWASINGPESWDANPWVWVVEFKVISTTQD